MTDDTGPGPDWDDEDAVLAALGETMGHDPTRTPPPDRIAAVRAAAERMRDAGDGPAVVPIRRPGRSVVDDEPAEAPVEAIAFTGAAAGTTKAGLINHTWGTELLLDVEGLQAGSAYDVVYLTGEGAEVLAGSLLAVDGVLMRCRFSAATLRRDVRTIVVRRGAEEALRSDLPAVET